MRILIAEDDINIRLLLESLLQHWGHDVVAVSDGAEAWEILNKEQISFVISDWMMPRLNGLELCRRIRAAKFQRYIYVILLTAKNDKKEIVKGMEAGADDFVTKPYDKGELNSRIRAGERILKLESDLEERNRKLEIAYSIIKEDLEAAAKMQESLLPSAALELPGFKFNWIFIPYIGVAGDIFNFFQFNENAIGFYLLDVAGHGIPSAMLSVTLSKVLSPISGQGSPLKFKAANSSHYEVSSPAKAVQKINQRFQADDYSMLYFTMIYGVVDIKNKRLKISQAGHPPPIYVRNGGDISFIETKDPPVGILPDLNYKEYELDFQKGDRLLLYSDGITECMNKKNEMYSSDRLMQKVNDWRTLPLNKLMKKLEGNLRHWRGRDEFDDDVSLLAIEMS